MSREVKMVILNLWLYMTAILILSFEPPVLGVSHHFGFGLHDNLNKKARPGRVHVRGRGPQGKQFRADSRFLD